MTKQTDTAQPASQRRTTGRPVRHLLAYARPYLWLMIVSLLSILATTLLINALPMILQRAIDHYLVPEGDMGMTERLTGLSRMGGLYLGLATSGFLLRMGQGLLTAWIGQSIVRDLRRDVFDKALRLGLPYFDRTPVGTLMTRVTSDVEAVQRFVTEGIVGLVADLCMLIGIAGYMVYLNPRLAGLTALLLPPLVFFLEKVNRRLRQANRNIRTRQAKLNAGIQEQLSGMITIQLFNREPQARERFEAVNSGLRDAHFEEVRWFSHFFPLIELGHNSATVLLVGVGGWLVLSEGAGLTVGMLVAFLTYVRNFFWPLSSLSDKASSYQRAMAATERIFELLDTHEDIPEPEPETPGAASKSAGSSLPPGGGDIRFQRISFAYQENDWVLRDFNLHIRQGEALAIVGATGAGKTTLINLLTRFYDVQHGKITINGTDIRRIPTAELRRRVGLVLQEPFIFAGTVADNIGLGNPDVSRQDIILAAHHVNAHRFIERLPAGYETKLSGRGGSLSGGEKQLLAMARTLAQQPDLVLILDEATANVDTYTETLIQQALQKLIHEQTTIAIAHRLSTIRDADRILVMKDGRISAEGNHEQLMANNAYYRHLVELLAFPAGSSTGGG